MAIYGKFTKDGTTVYTLPSDLDGYTIELTTTQPTVSDGSTATDLTGSNITATKTTIIKGYSQASASNNKLTLQVGDTPTDTISVDSQVFSNGSKYVVADGSNMLIASNYVSDTVDTADNDYVTLSSYSSDWTSSGGADTIRSAANVKITTSDGNNVVSAVGEVIAHGKSTISRYDNNPIKVNASSGTITLSDYDSASSDKITISGALSKINGAETGEVGSGSNVTLKADANVVLTGKGGSDISFIDSTGIEWTAKYDSNKYHLEGTNNSITNSLALTNIATKLTNEKGGDTDNPLAITLGKGSNTIISSANNVKVSGGGGAAGQLVITSATTGVEIDVSANTGANTIVSTGTNDGLKVTLKGSAADKVYIANGTVSNAGGGATIGAVGDTSFNISAGTAPTAFATNANSGTRTIYYNKGALTISDTSANDKLYNVGAAIPTGDGTNMTLGSITLKAAGTQEITTYTDATDATERKWKYKAQTFDTSSSAVYLIKNVTGNYEGISANEDITVDSSVSNISITLGKSSNEHIVTTSGSNITITSAAADGAKTKVNVSSGSAEVTGGKLGETVVDVTSADKFTFTGAAGAATVNVTNGSNINLTSGAGSATYNITSGSAVTITGGAGETTANVTEVDGLTITGGNGDEKVTIGASAKNVTITEFGAKGSDEATIQSSSVTITAKGGGISLSGDGVKSTIEISDGANLTVSGATSGTTFKINSTDSVSATSSDGGSNVTLAIGTKTTVTIKNTETGQSALTEFTVTNSAGANTTTVPASMTFKLLAAADGAIKAGYYNVIEAANATENGTTYIQGSSGADSITYTDTNAIRIVTGGGDDVVKTTSTGEVTVTAADSKGVKYINVSNGLIIGGADGNSTLELGAGTISGGKGAEIIKTSGDVTINGGGGDDVIESMSGGSGGHRLIQLLTSGTGADTVKDYNSELDTIEVGAASTQINLSLSDGTNVLVQAGSSTVGTLMGAKDKDIKVKDSSGVDHVFGYTSENGVNAFVEKFTGADKDTNNVIVGSTRVDSIVNSENGVTINADAGADYVNNSGSNVLINLGAGDDSITNSATDVTINADSGDDKIELTGSASNVLINLTSGANSVQAAASLAITVVGGSGADYISDTATSPSATDHKRYIETDGAGGDTIGNYASGDTIAVTSTVDNSKFKVSGSNDAILEITSSKSVSLQNALTNGRIVTVLNTSDSVVTEYYNIAEGEYGLADANSNQWVTRKVVNSSELYEGTGAEDSIYISDKQSDGTTALENAKVSGGAGKDWITNLGVKSSISAGAGDDIIYTSGSNASIYAGAGNDTIFSSGEGDYIELGGGANVLELGSNSGIVTVKSGSDADLISNVNQFNDTNFAITGTAANVSRLIILDSNAAMDTLDYAVGYDTLQISDNSGERVSWSAQLAKDDGSTVANDSSDGTNVLLTFGANNQVLLKGAASAGAITVINGGKEETVQFSASNENNISDRFVNVVNVTEATKGSVLDDNSNVRVIAAANNSITNEVSGVSIGADVEMSGADIVINRSSAYISLGAGNDSILNSGENTTIYAGEGDDTITNSAANVTIHAESGSNAIITGSETGVAIYIDGDDTISNDVNVSNASRTINISGINNVLKNYDSTDTLQISENTNNIISSLAVGETNDVKVMNGTNVMISLVGGNASGTTLNINEQQVIYGKDAIGSNAFINVITDDSKVTVGSDNTDSVNVSGSANYTLNAGSGNDILEIGTGSITLGSGSNSLKVSESATISGSSETGKSDTIIASGGKIAFIGAGASAIIDMSGTEDSTITGGAGDESIKGGSGKRTIVMSGGSDTIADYNSTYDSEGKVDGGDTIVAIGLTDYAASVKHTVDGSTTNVRIQYTSGNATNTLILQGTDVKDKTLVLKTSEATDNDGLVYLKYDTDIDSGGKYVNVKMDATGNTSGGDDIITLTKGGSADNLAKLDAQDGNDLITLKDSAKYVSVNAGAGSDTIYVETANNRIEINAGDNNLVSLGSDANDNTVLAGASGSASIISDAEKEVYINLSGTATNLVSISGNAANADALDNAVAAYITLGSGENNVSFKETGKMARRYFNINSGSGTIDYAEGDTLEGANVTSLSVSNNDVKVGENITLTNASNKLINLKDDPDNTNTESVHQYAYKTEFAADNKPGYFVNVKTSEGALNYTGLTSVRNSIVGGGNSELVGGEQADIINLYGKGTVSGGAGADTITTTEDNVSINAGAGADSIIAVGGKSTIDLADGVGTVYALGDNSSVKVGGDNTSANAYIFTAGGDKVTLDLTGAAGNVNIATVDAYSYQKEDGQTTNVNGVTAANTRVILVDENSKVSLNSFVNADGSAKVGEGDIISLSSANLKKLETPTLTADGIVINAVSDNATNAIVKIDSSATNSAIVLTDGNNTYGFKYAGEAGFVNYIDAENLKKLSGEGTDYNDSIIADTSGITINAKGGADYIYNEASKASVNAGAGADLIINAGDKVTIAATSGDDTIRNYTGGDGAVINLGEANGTNKQVLFNEAAEVSINAAGGENTIVTSAYGTTGLEATINAAGGTNLISLDAFVDIDTKKSDGTTTFNLTSGRAISGLTYDRTIIISGESTNTINYGSGDKLVINNEAGAVAALNSITFDTTDDNVKISFKDKTGTTTLKEAKSKSTELTINENKYQYTTNALLTNTSNVMVHIVDNGDGGTTSLSAADLANSGIDSIKNAIDKATIDGGAEADIILNSADNVSINGGAGADYIYNGGSGTIFGGGEADTIINSAEGAYISLSGGDLYTKDNVSIVGSSANITIDNADGNDVHITLNGDTVENKNISFDPTEYKVSEDASSTSTQKQTRHFYITSDFKASTIKDFKGTDEIIDYTGTAKIGDPDSDGKVEITINSTTKLTLTKVKDDSNNYEPITIVNAKDTDNKVSTTYTYLTEKQKYYLQIDNFDDASGKDVITGTPSNEIINNYKSGEASQKVQITGGGADDIINNNASNVNIKTEGGADAITSSGANVSIDAGAGANVVSVVGADNTIISGEGNDTIYAEGAGAININAGEGSNLILLRQYTGGAGSADGVANITLSGGESTIRNYLSASDSDAGVTNGATHAMTYGDPQVSATETAVLKRTLTITENSGKNYLTNYSSNDKIVLSGNADVSTINVSETNDVSIKLGEENSLTLSGGASQDVTITGADGTQKYLFRKDDNKVYHNIIGEESAESYTNSNGISLTDFNDSVISATMANNVKLSLGGGDDYIKITNGGTASLYAESGNNTIEATNLGYIEGGAGADSVKVESSTTNSAVTISLGGGNDTVTGSQKKVVIVGQEDGADVIESWAKGDIISVNADYGLSKADSISVEKTTDGAKVTFGSNNYISLGSSAQSAPIEIHDTNGLLRKVTFEGSEAWNVIEAANTDTDNDGTNDIIKGTGNHDSIVASDINVDASANEASTALGDRISVSASSGKEVNITAGTDNDSIFTSGAGAFIINSGVGSDTIGGDNTGSRTIIVSGGEVASGKTNELLVTNFSSANDTIKITDASDGINYTNVKLSDGVHTNDSNIELTIGAASEHITLQSTSAIDTIAIVDKEDKVVRTARYNTGLNTFINIIDNATDTSKVITGTSDIDSIRVATASASVKDSNAAANIVSIEAAATDVKVELGAGADTIDIRATGVSINAGGGADSINIGSAATGASIFAGSKQSGEAILTGFTSENATITTDKSDIATTDITGDAADATLKVGNDRKLVIKGMGATNKLIHVAANAGTSLKTFTFDGTNAYNFIESAAIATGTSDNDSVVVTSDFNATQGGNDKILITGDASIAAGSGKTEVTVSDNKKATVSAELGGTITVSNASGTSERIVQIKSGVATTATLDLNTNDTIQVTDKDNYTFAGDISEAVSGDDIVVTVGKDGSKSTVTFKDAKTATDKFINIVGKEADGTVNPIKTIAYDNGTFYNVINDKPNDGETIKGTGATDSIYATKHLVDLSADTTTNKVVLGTGASLKGGTTANDVTVNESAEVSIESSAAGTLNIANESGKTSKRTIYATAGTINITDFAAGSDVIKTNINTPADVTTTNIDTSDGWAALKVSGATFNLGTSVADGTGVSIESADGTLIQYLAKDENKGFVNHITADNKAAFADNNVIKGTAAQDSIEAAASDKIDLAGDTSINYINLAAGASLNANGGEQHVTATGEGAIVKVSGGKATVEGSASRIIDISGSAAVSVGTTSDATKLDIIRTSLEGYENASDLTIAKSDNSGTKISYGGAAVDIANAQSAQISITSADGTKLIQQVAYDNTAGYVNIINEANKAQFTKGEVVYGTAKVDSITVSNSTIDLSADTTTNYVNATTSTLTVGSDSTHITLNGDGSKVIATKGSSTITGGSKRTIEVSSTAKVQIEDLAATDIIKATEVANLSENSEITISDSANSEGYYELSINSAKVLLKNATDLSVNVVAADNTTVKSLALSDSKWYNVITAPVSGDTIFGTASRDSITSTEKDVDAATYANVSGQGGDIIKVTGKSGTDEKTNILAGSDADTIDVVSGNVSVNAGAGDDSIKTAAGNVTISAGAGANVISGSATKRVIEVAKDETATVNIETFASSGDTIRVTDVNNNINYNDANLTSATELEIGKTKVTLGGNSDSVRIIDAEGAIIRTLKFENNKQINYIDNELNAEGAIKDTADDDVIKYDGSTNPDVTISAATGNNTINATSIAEVDLTGGNNTLSATGVKVIDVSNGTNSISANDNTQISLVGGTNTIELTGTNSTIISSNTTDTISGGSGRTISVSGSNSGTLTITDLNANAVDTIVTDISSYENATQVQAAHSGGNTTITINNRTITANSYSKTNILVLGTDSDGNTFTLKNLKYLEDASRYVNYIEYSDEATKTTDTTPISGTADDEYIVNAKASSINGYGGADTIINSAANTTIDLTIGNGTDSVLSGTAENKADSVTIKLGANAGEVEAYGDSNTVVGNSGADSVYYQGSSGLINLAEGANEATVIGGNNTVTAGASNDTLYVGGGTEVSVNAGDGNDVIITALANDQNMTIDAGKGNNTVSSALEIDGNTLEVTQKDDTNTKVAKGDTTKRTFIVDASGGNLVITDYSSKGYSDSNPTGDQLVINGDNLKLDDMQGDNVSLSGNDVVITASNAKVTLQNAKDTTIALNVNGSIVGKTFNEQLGKFMNTFTDENGTGGQDYILVATAGKDIDAGADADFVDVRAASTVSGGDGADTINIIGTNADGATVTGGEGNDRIINTAAATVLGGAGTDTILSTNAEATIDGEAGDDIIITTQTDSTKGVTIVGGNGADVVSNEFTTGRYVSTTQIINRVVDGNNIYETITPVENGAAVNPETLKGTVSEDGQTATFENSNTTYTLVHNRTFYIDGEQSGSMTVKDYAEGDVIAIKENKTGTGVYTKLSAALAAANSETVVFTIGNAKVLLKDAVDKKITVRDFNTLTDGEPTETTYAYADKDHGVVTVSLIKDATQVPTYGDIADSIDVATTANIDAGNGANIINNIGEESVLKSGSGNDEIHNVANKVTVDAGDGQDNIYSYGNAVSINAGEGANNIYITQTEAGDDNKVTVTGGNANDYIENGFYSFRITDGDNTTVQTVDDKKVNVTRTIITNGEAKTDVGAISTIPADQENDTESSIKLTWSTNESNLADETLVYNRVIQFNGGQDVVADYHAGEIIELLTISDESKYTVQGSTANEDAVIVIDASNKITLKNAKDQVITVKVGESTKQATWNGSEFVQLIKINDEGTLPGGATPTDNADQIVISEDATDVKIDAKAGNDVINNEGAKNSLVGGAGADKIISSGDNVTADGGADDDQITISGNEISVNGGSGSDQITLLQTAVEQTATLDLTTGANVVTSSVSSALSEGEKAKAYKRTFQIGTDASNVNEIKDFNGENDTIVVSGTSNSYKFSTVTGGVVLENGSGKTTLANAQNQTITVYDGETEISGEEVKKAAKFAIAENTFVRIYTDEDIDGKAITTVDDKQVSVVAINSDVENITTGTNADFIRNGVANVVITAKAGNDIVYNMGEGAKIDLGEGADKIYNNSNDASINAGNGNDTIYAISYHTVSSAQADADEADVVGAGATIHVGEGNDYIANIEGTVVMDDNTTLAAHRSDSIKVTTTEDPDGTIYKLAGGRTYVLDSTLNGGANTIAGFMDDDTIAVDASAVTASYKNGNVVLTFNKASFTLTDASDKKIHITRNVTGAEKYDHINDTVLAYIDNKFVKIMEDETTYKADENGNIIGTSAAESINVKAENVSVSADKGNDTVNVYTTAATDEDGNVTGARVTVNGGEGDDVINLIHYDKKDTEKGETTNLHGAAVIEYANGDGKDTVNHYDTDSQIVFSSAPTKTTVNNGVVQFTVGTGSLTVTEADNKKVYVTVVDSDGQVVSSTRQVYGTDTAVIDATDVEQNDDGKYIYDASFNTSVKGISASNVTAALTIIANGNANTITGGSGENTYTGGSGADVFVATGSAVEITDYATEDKVVFTEAIKKAEVDGNTLTITYGNDKTVTIDTGVKKAITVIESITSTAEDGKEETTVSQTIRQYDGAKATLTATSATADTITVAQEDSFDLINASTRTTAIEIDASASDRATTINSGKGADLLTLGEEGGSINAGAGKDTLVGQGNAVLYGGNDADLFVVKGTATIADYTANADQISLLAATSDDGNTTETADAADAKVGLNANNVTLVGNDGSEIQVTNGKGKRITFVESIAETNGYEGLDSSQKILYTPIIVNSATNIAMQMLNADGGDGLVYDARTAAASAVTSIDASKRSYRTMIYANDADSTVKGGTKDDTIFGGGGDNVYTGGAGADVFIYSGGNDTITDYTTADQISIAADIVINSYHVAGKDVILEVAEGDDGTSSTTKSLTIVNGKDKILNLSGNSVADTLTKAKVFEDVREKIYTKAEGQSAGNGGEMAALGSAIETVNAAKVTNASITYDVSAAAQGVIFTGSAKADVIITSAHEDSIKTSGGKDTIGISAGADVTISDYAAGSDVISLNADEYVSDISTVTNGKNKDLVLEISKADSKVSKVTLSGKATAAVTIYESSTGEYTVKQAKNKNTLTFTDKSKSDITLATNLYDSVIATGRTKKNGIIISGLNNGEWVKGGKGQDTLYAGVDGNTLTGGAEKDVFAITNLTDGKTNVITDYVAGTDEIFLNSDITVSDSTLVGNNVRLTLTQGSAVSTLQVNSAKGKQITIYDNYSDSTSTEPHKATLIYGNGMASLKANGTTITEADATANARFNLVKAVDVSAGKATGNIIAQANSVTTPSYNAGTSASKGSILKGGSKEDTLFGSSLNDTFTGGAKNDIFVKGAGGDDVITDYAAGDVISLSGSQAITGVSLSGGAKSTTVVMQIDQNSGTLTLLKGKGKQVTIADPTGGNHTFLVGDGATLQPTAAYLRDNQVLSAETLPSYVSAIDASKGTVDLYIDANKKNDNTVNDMLIKGGTGNDTIISSTGNDTMTGGKGNDLFIVSANGKNVITDYGTGTDTISIADGKTIDQFGLTNGKKDVELTIGSSTLTVKNGKGKKLNIEGLGGSIIFGESNTATLSVTESDLTNGQIKDNTVKDYYSKVTHIDASAIKATAGGLTIEASGTVKQVKGSKGDDRITSATTGNGATLTGGAGNDTFVWSGASTDIITDYTAGKDIIQLLTSSASAYKIKGKDLQFTNGANTLTIKNGAGKKFTIIEGNGNVTQTTVALKKDGLSVYGNEAPTLTVAEEEVVTADLTSAVTKADTTNASGAADVTSIDTTTATSAAATNAVDDIWFTADDNNIATAEANVSDMVEATSTGNTDNVISTVNTTVDPSQLTTTTTDIANVTDDSTKKTTNN